MKKTNKENISGREGGSGKAESRYQASGLGKKSSVNINIEIPDEIHKKLKLAAIISNLTLKDFIIKSLEEETDGKR